MPYLLLISYATLITLLPTFTYDFAGTECASVLAQHNTLFLYGNGQIASGSLWQASFTSPIALENFIFYAYTVYTGMLEGGSIH